jgi:hypothetical protein
MELTSESVTSDANSNLLSDLERFLEQQPVSAMKDVECTTHRNTIVTPAIFLSFG